MFILAVKENDKIYIGENTSIKVLQIRGKEVKLGIETTPDFKVLRHKLWKEGNIGNLKTFNPLMANP